MKEQAKLYPTVPKDFITAPIFAAKPQSGSRTVSVNGKTYTIGGFKPISEDRPACPALDIRHGRALFTLLSYLDPADYETKVRFSIKDFCKRYSNGSWSGRYARDVLGILSDLERCWFKITAEDGASESYRILKDISIRQREPRKKPGQREIQMNMRIDEVELHPKFFVMIRDYLNIAQINLKALTTIRSPLAQSIYAYIPSRAVHNTAQSPFEITLTNLLTQVGNIAPECKSIRKRIFTQNSNPVISQLDGAEVVTGNLRAVLAETTDGRDYKIKFWVEKGAGSLKIKEDKGGVLLDIWLKQGRSKEGFMELIKPPLPELSSYHQDLMAVAKVDLKGNAVFFRQALALLGESTFLELLGDAKSAMLEGRKINKTPTKRLIHYIKEALKS